MHVDTVTEAATTILGVIPARGGSKGIRKKNLRLLDGLPLIAHRIKSAIASTRLTRCIVSTDDPEIAAVARDFGGEVPFLRPSALSADDSPTWGVLQHAVEWIEGNDTGRVGAVVTLQPTAPLCLATDIDAAVECFSSNQPHAECLASVCDAASHHPLTLYYQSDEYLSPFLPGLNPNTRRQKFPSIFWRNGAIYITRRDLLFRERRVISDRPLAYIMPRSRSANIDELVDLEIAEVMLRHLALRDE